MKNDKLYLFFRGWLTVCADGPFTERLINICIHRNMKIFDIKTVGATRVCFKTDVNSYLHIRGAAKRTRSHVRIIKRHGMPFIIKKYKRRKSLCIGVLACFVLLWYASNHILGITIYGNDRVDTRTIKNALNDCGLSIGTKTSDITPDYIRNRLMTDISDLAWVGINANGSRVYIEIVERSPIDKGVDKNAPACNLVASKDGEIEKTEVREGQTLVTIGSGVRKGDVLVSGISDSDLNGFDYVHARGEIIAKTYYKEKGTYPLKLTENVKTGNVKHRYKIKIGDKFEIAPLGKVHTYDLFEYDEKSFAFNIPIIQKQAVLKREMYTETSSVNKMLSVKEAFELGKEELINRIKAQLPENADIIEENSTYTITEFNSVEVTTELVCREDIAEEMIIEIPLTD